MALLDDDKKQAPRDRSDRPSWREIDRRKEKGSDGYEGGGAPRAGTKAAYLQERVSKKARSAADALFSDPAEKTAREAILKAADKSAVVSAVDVYRAKYDQLPSDSDILLQALQHPEEDVLLEALKFMGELIPELTGTTKEVALRGVRLFQMTSRNMPARKAAKRIVKRNSL